MTTKIWIIFFLFSKSNQVSASLCRVPASLSCLFFILWCGSFGCGAQARIAYVINHSKTVLGLINGQVKKVADLFSIKGNMEKFLKIIVFLNLLTSSNGNNFINKNVIVYVFLYYTASLVCVWFKKNLIYICRGLHLVINIYFISCRVSLIMAPVRQFILVL